VKRKKIALVSLEQLRSEEERTAKHQQKTPKQVALAWLLKRSPIMLPIPGTSSIEHLEENLGAASLQLTAEEYRELTSVSEPPPSFRG